MSAFIVEVETMDRVVASPRLPPKDVDVPELLEMKSNEDATAVGKALYRMNVEAVAGRYENRPEYEWMFQYQWPPQAAAPMVQSLKSCECLLYQCAEDVRG